MHGELSRTIAGRSRGTDIIMPAWFYILRLSSGATSDLEQRISNHFSGRGCRITHSDPPLAIKYTEQFDTMHEALQREKQIKDWTRTSRHKTAGSAKRQTS